MPTRTAARSSGTSRRWLRSLMLACAGASLLAAAPAQASQVSVLAGGLDGYRNIGLSWQSDALWRHDFGSQALDLSVEASLGRAFGPSGASSPSSPSAGPLWHVGVTPFARWWFTPNTALEAGIGANLFSGTYIGSKQLATAYQFGDSLGLYHRIDNTPWGVGVRFTHYSNAGIKHPNPGQNYLQLRLSHELQ